MRQPQAPYDTPTSRPRRGRTAGGVLGGAGVLLAKFGGLLLKAKPLLTALISVAAYALIYRWPFAVGLVALIAVHEIGHVVALRALGVKAGLPTFIPFVGAFVSMKEQPRTAREEAWSALAGPAVGGVGALVLYVIAQAWVGGTSTAGTSGVGGLLMALAYTGGLLNLFQLLPFLPLDGGRAAAAVSTKLWAVGLLGALAALWWTRSAILLLVLVMGGAEMFRRVRARRRGQDVAYYDLPVRVRTQIGAAYLLTAAGCATLAVAAYAPAAFGTR